MEVEEAEVDKRGKRINWATEVEGREGEAHHSAVWGALNSEPGGGAGVASGPVGEEVAVGVGLEAELGEGECIILPCTLCNIEDGEGQCQ